MVKYTIHTTGEMIIGFQVTGHAGYADKGRDIICAGVSAIAQTAALGLINQVDNVRWEQKSGKLICRVGQIQSEEQKIAAQAILRSMQLGIEALCEAYPDYVRVEYKEV